MSALLSKLKKIYTNLRGFHTTRKLIVFESDDWGSIRMPSKAIFQKLSNLGDNPGRDAYLSNDCLESKSDLLELFNVLSLFKDSVGNHPVFTLNFAVANPDFDKINIKDGFYYYEPFYKTYDKYYGDNQILSIIKNGIKENLILPQLHCREHLNVGRWMRDLSNNKQDTMLAFECKTMGVGESFHTDNVYGYMDSFNTDCSSSSDLSEILKDAINLFENIFGYKSSTFVASCYVWDDYFEKNLKNNGIMYIQSGIWQYKPIGKNGKYKLKRVLRFLGQKNRNKQIYSIRNCNYEPAYLQNPDFCVEECLKEIDSAFKARKPAVISSHRFNYIGSINPDNRKNNLVGLRKLLNSIIEKYPDVEFVSSEELFELMSKN